MNDLVYYITLFLTTILFGIITFSDEITKRKFYKNLIRRKNYGWLKLQNVTIFKIVLFTFLTGLSIFTSYQRENFLKWQSINDQNLRDSIAEKRRVETVNSMTSTFAKGLAEYGLKYDSTTRIVERLVKDSISREYKYLSMTRPNLELDKIILTDINNESLLFELKILCSSSTAFNVKLKGKYGYVDSIGRLFMLFKHDLKVAADGQIAVDRFRTIKVKLPKMPKSNLYIFYIYGSYTDIPQYNTIYPLERLVEFNIETREMKLVSKTNSDQIAQFVKEY